MRAASSRSTSFETSVTASRLRALEPERAEVADGARIVQNNPISSLQSSQRRIGRGSEPAADRYRFDLSPSRSSSGRSTYVQWMTLK